MWSYTAGSGRRPRAVGCCLACSRSISPAGGRRGCVHGRRESGTESSAPWTPCPRWPSPPLCTPPWEWTVHWNSGHNRSYVSLINTNTTTLCLPYICLDLNRISFSVDVSPSLPEPNKPLSHSSLFLFSNLKNISFILLAAPVSLIQQLTTQLKPRFRHFIGYMWTLLKNKLMAFERLHQRQ